MPNKCVPALPAGIPDDPRANSIITMLNLLASDPERADVRTITTILANLIACYPADARERLLASAPTRLREIISGIPR